MCLLMFPAAAVAIRAVARLCDPIWIYECGTDTFTILKSLMRASTVFWAFCARGSRSRICNANYQHAGNCKCHAGKCMSHDTHVTVSCALSGRVPKSPQGICDTIALVPKILERPPCVNKHF